MILLIQHIAIYMQELSMIIERSFMGSIQVHELKSLLEEVPDDYEVIMEITTRYDCKAGTSIAYINGACKDDERKEYKLMN